MVLNFWATWCEPCKEEMPSLDRLQSKFDKNKLKVIAINLDRGPKKKAIAFFEDNNIKNISLFFDSKNNIPREVKALGLPATILIDQNGTKQGILSIDEALTEAKKVSLDLVQVSASDASPPGLMPKLNLPSNI